MAFLHRGISVDNGNIGHDALYPRVGRTDRENVTTAVRNPPDSDAIAVDLVEGLQIGDRILVVLLLVLWNEVLPRNAGAAATAPTAGLGEVAPSQCRASAQARCMASDSLFCGIFWFIRTPLCRINSML